MGGVLGLKNCGPFVLSAAIPILSCSTSISKSFHIHQEGMQMLLGSLLTPYTNHVEAGAVFQLLWNSCLSPKLEGTPYWACPEGCGSPWKTQRSVLLKSPLTIYRSLKISISHNLTQIMITQPFKLISISLIQWDHDFIFSFTITSLTQNFMF